MIIIISPFKGNIFNLNIPVFTSVYSLKKICSTICNIHVNDMKMVFNEITLYNDKTMYTYGFKDGDLLSIQRFEIEESSNSLGK